MACMISCSPPLDGRLEPATDMAMPDSTSASASTVSISSVSIEPGWCSTASAALRPSSRASPSMGSPVWRWESSQSAAAERLRTASPTPERTSRAGAEWTRSRSITTATGIATPNDPLPDSCSSELTGDAMPSCARLVATATIGMPAMWAANLVTSMVRPPPIPATASYDAARSRLPRRTAVSTVPSSTRKSSPAPSSSSSAMLSPCPGPTATATRPSVAIRRSASNALKPVTASRRTSMNNGAGIIRASSGIEEPPHASAPGRDLTRPAQVVVVVDLDPLHRTYWCHRDSPAAISEFLVAILVEQPRITPPRCLESVRERRGRRRLDERDADVLRVRAHRIHLLGDPRQQTTAIQRHLHFLIAKRLNVVDGEHQVAVPPVAGGEQRLLYGNGVHRVTVGQQDALGEVLTRQPQRVCVVPLAGPVVMHKLEPHPVRPLQRGHSLRHRVCGMTDDHGHVPHADRRQVPQGDIQDGGPTVDREQRLGQGVGFWAESASHPRGEHHADHRPPPSSRPAGPGVLGHRGVPVDRRSWLAGSP